MSITDKAYKRLIDMKKLNKYKPDELFLNVDHFQKIFVNILKRLEPVAKIIEGYLVTCKDPNLRAIDFDEYGLHTLCECSWKLFFL